MTEWLTLVNEKGIKQGKKLRDDIHRDGDWHETFHCWFVEQDDDDISLYFQLRAYNKKNLPGIWDVTSAGHIMHGEDILTGGIRELKEELGLSFYTTNLVYKGIYKTNHEYLNFIDREMCHVYFHIVTKPIVFALGNEVEDIMKINATVLWKLLKGEQSLVTATPVISAKTEPIVVTLQDISAFEIDYYQFVIEQGRNILKTNIL
ncbi:NUDIX hydrolase [Bacillus cereus]|uniref:DNA mismatch repair protein MutT n=1 Tax=Bacillus cereus TaxID=1396 RepID=A0A2A8ZTG4_BACCE|nr:NUDIX domain-containing protein [Bacillus cereus]PFE09038.1 DNA mismatch repair protein MutT [Bacillus cereus]